MPIDLDIPASERLAKLIRLLSSDREGEVVNAARAIRRTLKDKGLDIHTLADMVVGSDKRPTKSDLQEAYRAGYRDGTRAAEPDDDTLSWREIAKFCLANAARLKPHETDFVEQMVRWTSLGREPTAKQARWLDYLYAQLKHNKRRRSRRDRHND